MDELQKKLRSLPLEGGVYLLKDDNGKIIYIGKAISIKKRVRQHLKAAFAKQIRSVDFVLTNSELDSLILEAKLIKKHLPKYNISLKDDKRYPYIRLSVNEKFPGIGISRRILKDGAKYYGPFRGGTTRSIIKFLSKMFGIRRCTDVMLKKRRQACLERSRGACLDYFTKRCAGPCAGKVTREQYDKIVSFIKEFFEGGAQKLKDNLYAEMKKVSEIEDFEQAASLRDKIKWLEHEVNLYSFKKPRQMKDALFELKNVLALNKIPKRIEAFDISNLGAFETVGSMVVFQNGLPYKNHYRKFKIKLGHVPNDTAAIYELIYRRYNGSLKKELPDPDLIVVDGGAPQLGSAQKVFKDSKLRNIPIIGLAKRLEHIYTSRNGGVIKQGKDSKALQILQHIRDEAHRFAITFLKSRRKKQLAESFDMIINEAK